MIYYILITIHLIADFTFQPEHLAETKKTEITAVLKHSAIYLITFVVAGLLLFNKPYAYIIPVAITFFHRVTDVIRRSVEKHAKKKPLVFGMFIADQALHVLTILVVCAACNAPKQASAGFLQLSKSTWFCDAVLYSMLLVIVLDPAAAFIKKLFVLISDKKESGKDNPSVGRIIGKLERVITVVLILCNQYGAVGLILTAKSIARFKQMEDKDFAEKYLVGTLTSLLIALVSALLVVYIKSHLS